VKYAGKQWQLVKTAKGETPTPSNAPAPGKTY
jgi:hypothetical protein